MPRTDKTRAAEDKAFARMAPVISHEMRNPLAAIGNSAYYIKAKLESSGISDPKISKHVQIIESQVRNVDATLAQILAYTRMREPVLKPVGLGAVARAAADSMTWPEGASPAWRLPAGDPVVRGDEELLSKAVASLLANAIQAAPSGEVLASVSESDGWASLEVADRGPGLCQEARESLFLPFFTTRPKGIGLGLAFAFKAVLRHKGRLEALESGAGEGARFRLSLPISA